VYFTQAELEGVRSMLSAANPERRPVTAFVLQGSGGQRTGWHDDRFAEVIRYVERQLGHCTVFLGTAADEPVIERIRNAAGSNGVSLAGRTTVLELAALLCLSDLLITLDTGTMHAGRASATPMVVLGPSWQRPLEWLPLDKPQARILRGEDRESVPPEYKLDEVRPQEVIAAAEELLRMYPPAQAAREARVAARLSTTRAT
jgi:ADP-heptose:LPS heptosyltransferase